MLREPSDSEEKSSEYSESSESYSTCNYDNKFYYI